MRNREERLRVRSEDGLLVGKVINTYREDRCGRRGRITEPSQVGLTEGPLPRECLPSDEPSAVAMTFALGCLGHIQGHLSHLVDAHHHRKVPANHPTHRSL